MDRKYIWVTAILNLKIFTAGAGLIFDKIGLFKFAFYSSNVLFLSCPGFLTVAISNLHFLFVLLCEDFCVSITQLSLKFTCRIFSILTQAVMSACRVAVQCSCIDFSTPRGGVPGLQDNFVLSPRVILFPTPIKNVSLSISHCIYRFHWTILKKTFSSN